jgi:glutaredoxin
MVRWWVFILLLWPAAASILRAETTQEALEVQKKPSLVLYYSSYCPYSQKVLRYLQKIHKTVPMKDVNDNPQYKEELARAGGQLLVPCLVIGGKGVYDADTIIEWLSSHQNLLENLISVKSFSRFSGSFEPLFDPNSGGNIHRGIQNLANGNGGASDLQQTQSLALRTLAKERRIALLQEEQGLCNHKLEIQSRQGLPRSEPTAWLASDLEVKRDAARELDETANCKDEDVDEASGQV